VRTLLLQQLINGISVGGIYALLATGYALIYSLLGFSNWAHGEVAMLGAYIAILSVTSLQMPFIFAVILAIVGAGLISVFNEKIAYKRIRDNNSPTMFLMIAAMGLSTTFQNMAIVVFGPKFKMFPQVLPVGAVKIGSLSVGLLDLVSLAIAIIVIIGLEYLITKTKFGLAVKAASSNMGTASLLGINVDKYIMLVFFLAGSLAGISGILYGMKYTVYPQLGNVALKAFIASVFGGLGSVQGAIIGAMGIGVLETLVSAYIHSGLRDLITFILLIAILLVRPTGLMGKDIQDKA
jgi:branched-chain amino acid transport system permease protein